jgi:hypothetical protein
MIRGSVEMNNQVIDLTQQNIIERCNVLLAHLQLALGQEFIITKALCQRQSLIVVCKIVTFDEFPVSLDMEIIELYSMQFKRGDIAIPAYQLKSVSS